MKIIIGEIDKTIEDNEDSFIALREVSWNNRGSNLELRKWHRNEDKIVAGKGVIFKDEDTLNVLAETLVALGYGETDKIQDILNERIIPATIEEHFYDAKDII